MTHSRKKIIFLLSTIILMGTGCSLKTTTPAIVTTRTVTPSKKIALDGIPISVHVAKSPREQQQGLSGVESLQPYEGMLFPYSPAAKPVFWMKDMLFAIDIIWIYNGQVVGIEKNVQPPYASHTDNTLPRYPSPQNVTAVLEVQAGWTTTHGIHNGSAVTGL